MAEPSNPSPSHTPRVGVVTVSYGSGEALEVFLTSLREHEGADQPVAVVDNKPDAENVREIAARFGAVYVPLPENPGYGAGMNAGVRALRERDRAGGPDGAGGPGESHSPRETIGASEPVVPAAPGEAGGSAFDAYFFCNPDVRWLAPTVGQLAASLLGDPAAGSIGPRLLNEDGSIYPSARGIPSVGTGVGHALFSKVWPGNPWSRAYQNADEYGERRPAGWLSGAAVMVKRGVFERIGGWDEAYFMHFEDVDLGWRLGRAGFTNVYEPAVSVEHQGAHSTKKHAVVVERAMTASAIRFMGKRYAGFWHAPLRWAITLGLRVRGWVRVRRAR